MNYSRMTSDVGMAMSMPPAMISPSGRVPRRASESPKMGSAMAAAAELFVDGGSGIQGFPEKMYK